MSRRPRRDERWTGPDGNTWQILRVKLRPNDPLPGYSLAYFMVRDTDSGLEAKVPAANLGEWQLKDPDPLEGKRKEITQGIRDGKGTFVLTAETVKKGELYHLSAGTIRIDKVSGKLVTGKGREWAVSFTLLREDRPQLLRRVPSGLPDGPGHSAGGSDIERARIESAYTSSPRQAIVDEPESVGPDWEDMGRAERETRRQKAVNDRMTEEKILVEATKLAARVKQEVIERGANGKDLTPLLSDVYERLAQDEAA